MTDQQTGERTQAQDEPMRQKCPGCAAGLERVFLGTWSGYAHRNSDGALGGCFAASPRPAEPPPPSSPEPSTGTGEQALEHTKGPKCINCGQRDGGYEIGNDNGCIAGPFCSMCFADIEAHYAPTSQPKADTGTLETLRNRIESLVNRGAEICATFKPEGAPSASAGCGTCGYSSDVHLLRDALTELRRMREEVESLRHMGAAADEQIDALVRQRDSLEARAASPSSLRLRELVERFKEREETFVRALRRLPDDDRSASAENIERQKDRLISAASANCWKLAHDELDALLRGTGEQP